MANWTEQITPEMLPGQHQHLLSIIGMEALLALCTSLGGTYYYIPKMDAIIKSARDKLIRAEFNGYNVKELALKYELSTVQIYTIIKESDVLPGQFSFFDEPLSV